MKNISTPFFISFVFLLNISCSKETNNIEASLITEEVSNELVTEYNQALFNKFGLVIPEIQKGFSTNGTLESELRQDGKDSYLILMFREKGEDGSITKTTKFDFGLDQKIAFPKSIENAKIIFIGNQLIIKDIQSDFSMNFFVKTDAKTVNKVSSIKTIDGRYLGIESVPNGITLRSAGKCICSCTACPAGSSCGTASCSCASCTSCSVSCRDRYEATCSDNCGQE